MKTSFEVEIDAKPNTPEYSKKIFSAMGNLMKEITKDLYPSEKRPIEYLVRRTNGDGFKVVEIEHLSPKYMTISTRRYFKTKDKAEEYKNVLISNSSSASQRRIIAIIRKK